MQVVCVLVSLMLFGYGQADAAEDIGAGTLIFTADEGQSFDAPRLQTEVKMQITGIVARVEVHQRFENPGDGWVEGAKVGDLYAGEPIVVTARVQGEVRGTLTPGTSLTLLTCYPFDAVIPGGPLRYAAIARPL